MMPGEKAKDFKGTMRQLLEYLNKYRLALLFVALDGSCGNPSVMVQTLNSNEQKVLIEGGTAPRYLPTGHIVYAKASTLLVVPFDLERLEPTGPHMPVLEGLASSSSYAGHLGLSLEAAAVLELVRHVVVAFGQPVGDRHRSRFVRQRHEQPGQRLPEELVELVDVARRAL